MRKQPTIKIGDRIRRRTDDGHVYLGICIRLTDKGIRCHWDNLDASYTTVLFYKNYGEFWEKVDQQ